MDSQWCLIHVPKDKAITIISERHQEALAWNCKHFFISKSIQCFTQSLIARNTNKNVHSVLTIFDTSCIETSHHLSNNKLFSLYFLIILHKSIYFRDSHNKIVSRSVCNAICWKRKLRQTLRLIRMNMNNLEEGNICWLFSFPIRSENDWMQVVD